MSEPFVGEIRMFSGKFAPRDWAFCNGQLLTVSQNTALFSILGNRYGGDGKTNFALPNLQGRAPLQQGQGAGLTNRPIGKPGGVTSVTLNETQMPAHTHQMKCDSGVGKKDSTAGGNIMAKNTSINFYAEASSEAAVMKPDALTVSGGSGAHNNMQPYLGVSFIIALQGDYPVRP